MRYLFLLLQLLFISSVTEFSESHAEDYESYDSDFDNSYDGDRSSSNSYDDQSSSSSYDDRSSSSSYDERSSSDNYDDYYRGNESSQNRDYQNTQSYGSSSNYYNGNQYGNYPGGGSYSNYGNYGNYGNYANGTNSRMYYPDSYLQSMEDSLKTGDIKQLNSSFMDLNSYKNVMSSNDNDNLSLISELYQSYRNLMNNPETIKKMNRNSPDFYLRTLNKLREDYQIMGYNIYRLFREDSQFRSRYQKKIDRYFGINNNLLDTLNLIIRHKEYPSLYQLSEAPMLSEDIWWNLENGQTPNLNGNSAANQYPSEYNMASQQPNDGKKPTKPGKKPNGSADANGENEEGTNQAPSSNLNQNNNPAQNGSTSNAAPDQATENQTSQDEEKDSGEEEQANKNQAENNQQTAEPIENQQIVDNPNGGGVGAVLFQNDGINRIGVNGNQINNGSDSSWSNAGVIVGGLMAAGGVGALMLNSDQVQPQPDGNSYQQTPARVETQNQSKIDQNSQQKSEKPSGDSSTNDQISQQESEGPAGDSPENLSAEENFGQESNENPETSNFDAEPVAQTDVEKNPDANPDTNAEFAAQTDAEANPETNTNENPDTSADTNADFNAEPETDSSSDLVENGEISDRAAQPTETMDQSEASNYVDRIPQNSRNSQQQNWTDQPTQQDFDQNNEFETDSANAENREISYEVSDGKFDHEISEEIPERAAATRDQTPVAPTRSAERRTSDIKNTGKVFRSSRTEIVSRRAPTEPVYLNDNDPSPSESGKSTQNRFQVIPAETTDSRLRRYNSDNEVLHATDF